MRRCLIILFTAFISTGMTAVATADTPLYRSDTFPDRSSATGDGWQTWSQRNETAPEFGIDSVHSVGGEGSLRISTASNAVANGCWRREQPVTPGSWYRFEASFCYRRIINPNYRVVAKLDWRNSDGGRAGQPDYAQPEYTTEEWHRVHGTFRAPEEAAMVRIELYLRFAPQGVVWWDDIRLSETVQPEPRIVRLGAINCRPVDSPSSEASVRAFAEMAAEAGRAGCDIVCLGEGVNLVGVRGASYSTVAEPIPGPATDILAAVAREYGMYIVAALGERDGAGIYNTAVLIDRAGQVTGKYRKVHLPREEIEAGVAPGNDYPVFETDFGRIGMMVCWDNQYSEPARAMRHRGAEIILMPIWGGNETLTRARAIENQMYIITGGYDMPSAVYNPEGDIIAVAEERPGFATIDVDLSHRFYDRWLGDMRSRFEREVRPDIPLTMPR